MEKILNEIGVGWARNIIVHVASKSHCIGGQRVLKDQLDHYANLSWDFKLPEPFKSCIVVNCRAGEGVR